MRWHRRNQTESETSAAFITEGSELVGTCSFNGSVVLSGHVKGEIHATGTLSVGRAGRVEARLHAPIVIIEGEVVGSIMATERIELREHARVHGDLRRILLQQHAGDASDHARRPLRRRNPRVGIEPSPWPPCA